MALPLIIPPHQLCSGADLNKPSLKDLTAKMSQTARLWDVVAVEVSPGQFRVIKARNSSKPNHNITFEELAALT